MKPTQEQALDWAFECDFVESTPAEDVFSAIYVCCPKDIERLVILAYEAGQESMKWDGIHSCHPDCQRPACVHTRKTYQEGYEAGRKDENEACASLEVHLITPTRDYTTMSPLDCYEAALMDEAMAFRAAIRARVKT